jgi:hypothetical protein
MLHRETPQTTCRESMIPPSTAGKTQQASHRTIPVKGGSLQAKEPRPPLPIPTAIMHYGTLQLDQLSAEHTSNTRRQRAEPLIHIA